MNIGIAHPAQAGGIRDIYAPFVRDGFVTFETQVPDKDNFAERIAQYTQKYPWLVMEENGMVLGYAYASAYRERIAYQWVVECSVYIHASHRKRGIAAKLYEALFEILRLQGLYKVYAVITVPNPQSVGFHEKMGFKWFATYENVGYKAGKWCHVGWWQLTLTEPDDSIPSAPTPFPQLDQLTVDKILEKYSN
ncbi:N-acetyltransferase family protein [Niabella yanshanensis]|uniref:N-acetyltransferase family protein n=1 Tax=Niabella yanshanensis TaxID=577386 RepID=A0ABZ0WBE3_9BACT|nr:GNAT family N-acetyltransferase [Niabella yanshanensis]WQD39295.1 N-acetyltransferase family protein [Niabella yanshanensis]